MVAIVARRWIGKTDLNSLAIDGRAVHCYSRFFCAPTVLEFDKSVSCLVARFTIIWMYTSVILPKGRNLSYSFPVLREMLILLTKSRFCCGSSSILQCIKFLKNAPGWLGQLPFHWLLLIVIFRCPLICLCWVRIWKCHTLWKGRKFLTFRSGDLLRELWTIAYGGCKNCKLLFL